MAKSTKTMIRALTAGGLITLMLVAGGWTLRHRIAGRVWRETPTVCEEQPVAERHAFTVSPSDGEASAPVDQPVRADVETEGLVLDPSTVTAATVALFRVRDRRVVAADIAAAKDGRAVVVTPRKALEAETNYQLVISNGIKDTAGHDVPPVQTAFSTAPAKPLDLPTFEKVELPTTKGLGITCVTVGPDGRFYATVDDGRLIRFTMKDDGTLADKTEIRSLVDSRGGGPRLIGGIALDPNAPADKPVVWVTHTSFGFINMGDWQGAVSRLSGPDLATVEDVVVNLPRSARDHILHQPSFGPDGCLYFQSGSMSSYGDPDGYWGWRREHPFSAAIVRIDPKKLPARLPLDVKTTDDNGHYEWRSADAPVSIFAGGMRVAFDLCWHSSGKLFAAVNGSSQGGNTPAGPMSPQLWQVPESEHDWLFRIEAGSYSGHPNPAQGAFVLNGGNPTAGPDFAEVPGYPVGTMPEKAWQPAVYDFGTHVSPNGMTEYRGAGALNGAILVCRYNVGNDLLAVRVDRAGNVVGVLANIPGCSDLENPLDVCEDVRTGNLYVSEYGKHAVTLLRRKS